MSLGTNTRTKEEQNAIQTFKDSGYMVEVQEYQNITSIGNYDVDSGEHYYDSQRIETDRFYYICDQEGYKLYNLEFESEEELLNFIVYSMKHKITLEALENDDILAKHHRKEAGKQ